MSYIRLFFKILLKNKISVVISMCIAIGFSILFMATTSTEEYKPMVCIVDQDQSSFSKQLVEEIERYSDTKPEKENKTAEERITNGDIESYIEIPKGLEEKFLNNEEVKIKHIAIENSQSEQFLNNKINNYLSQAQFYLANSNGTLDTFYELLKSEEGLIDLEVGGLRNESETIKVTNNTNAFNYMGYGIFYGVAGILAIFFIKIRQKQIRERYVVSPVSNRNYLFQIIVASLLFLIGFTILAILIISIGIVHSPIDQTFFLNVANLLCYGIFSLSFGLLVGMIVNKTDFANAIVTAFSLIISFLGGMFVPLSFFSDSVKLVSAFTPAYWYEKAVLAINTTGDVLMNNVLMYFGIQLLFAFAIFAIVAVINKQKASSQG